MEGLRLVPEELTVESYPTEETEAEGAERPWVPCTHCLSTCWPIMPMTW